MNKKTVCKGKGKNMICCQNSKKSEYASRFLNLKLILKM